jgi:hypothetical protein
MQFGRVFDAGQRDRSALYIEQPNRQTKPPKTLGIFDYPANRVFPSYA